MEIQETILLLFGAYEYDAGPDLIPPRVTGATLLDSVTLVVNFSEALDQATAEDENNYSINNNIKILTHRYPVQKLPFKHLPILRVSYAVTVVNVEDLAGNPVDPAHNTAQYEYIVFTHTLGVSSPECRRNNNRT